MEEIKEALLGDTEPVRPNMGIGKLGDPSITFVRQFRWTLSGDTLDEHFIRNVKFNFVARTIEFDAYEVVCGGEINIQEWLERPIYGETLNFTTFDGCGTALYTYNFGKLTLVSDTSEFDYSKSNESIRKISLTYETINRKFHVESPKKPSTLYRKKSFVWKMKTEGGEPVVVKLAARPNLSIEETEVNFLNATTWIPGKAKWELLEITMDTENSRQLVGSLMKGCTAELTLHDMYDEKLFETWTLEGVWVNRMTDEGEKTKIVLRYHQVKYEPAKAVEVSTVVHKEDCNV